MSEINDVTLADEQLRKLAEAIENHMPVQAFKCVTGGQNLTNSLITVKRESSFPVVKKHKDNYSKLKPVASPFTPS